MGFRRSHFKHEVKDRAKLNDFLDTKHNLKQRQAEASTRRSPSGPASYSSSRSGGGGGFPVGGLMLVLVVIFAIRKITS